TQAGLSYPWGIAVNSTGTTIYLSETNGSHRIRAISTSTGIIQTIAGSATASFSGDGGAAVSATFSSPGPLSLDSFNNLYVADMYNYRIRKINLGTMIINTVAGNGAFTLSEGAPATTSGIYYPRGVAADP